jgi:hypothetical protein
MFLIDYANLVRILIFSSLLMLIFFLHVDLEYALNEIDIAKEWHYAPLVAEGLENPLALNAIIERAFNGTKKERMRGCWILHHISDIRPELFYNKERKMIAQLDQMKTDAEARFILRYYSKYQLPRHDEREGKLLDLSFDAIIAPSQAAAPRVYAMSIVHRMVKKYPELASELAQSIEMACEHGTPGMKSRGGKILKDLAKKGLL